MTEFYWLNKDSELFLSRGYLREGETARQRIRDIADKAEDILKAEGFSDKFYSYMSKGWFSLASPIWANFGREKGMEISCFGSYIEDTLQDILWSAGEVGKQSQIGGGTSAYFGKIRSRGSKVSSGGESDGSVSFMRIFDTVVDVCKQASVRRGSFAAYLDINHKDIEEFLKIKSEGNPIQHIFTGVCISDNWMQSMVDGDKEKRKVWGKVLKSRSEIGLPYIFFTDTVNKNAPEIYKRIGRKIYASNLCVAPETLILTENGHIKISSLENKTVKVFNGKELSETKVVKTGQNQKLIKVILSSGRSLDCTEYHKFYVDKNNWIWSSEGNSKESDFVEVRAIDLKKGDLVRTYFTNHTNDYNYFQLDSVSEVIDEGRFDDTYCVNEPIEHKAVFNGILTGNCSEICLSSDETESFVCCLSSMNLVHYDEWKNTDAVETLCYFLDSVITSFLRKAEHEEYLKKAFNFAKNQRAIGVGVFGFHSLLQSKMISFESLQAMMINEDIFENLNKKTLEASKKSALQYGSPPLLQGTGERWATRIAIAPTTSSAFIIGQTSQSIEPEKSNYFNKELAKHKVVIKNKYLEKLLIEKEKNTKKVWDSIASNNGSVQHLDFLTIEEKDVFRTFQEISQRQIIDLAARRQKYIDQSQSLNLSIHPDTPVKEINELMIHAWKSGIKTLYYQHSSSAAQQFLRKLNQCVSCEG